MTTIIWTSVYLQSPFLQKKSPIYRDYNKLHVTVSASAWQHSQLPVVHVD